MIFFFGIIVGARICLVDDGLRGGFFLVLLAVMMVE